MSGCPAQLYLGPASRPDAVAPAGVGLPAQGITIYLEADTAEIHAAVAKALEPLKLAVPLHWLVTGKFER